MSNEIVIITGKTQAGTEYSEKLKISDMESADSTFIFSLGDLENEGSVIVLNRFLAGLFVRSENTESSLVYKLNMG